MEKNKLKKIKNSKPVSKEVFEFLQERQMMLKDGFPYCYVENFVPMHCNSCVEFFKRRLKTHNGIDNENVVFNPQQ